MPRHDMDSVWNKRRRNSRPHAQADVAAQCHPLFRPRFSCPVKPTMVSRPFCPKPPPIAPQDVGENVPEVLILPIKTFPPWPTANAEDRPLEQAFIGRSPVPIAVRPEGRSSSASAAAGARS